MVKLAKLYIAANIYDLDANLSFRLHIVTTQFLIILKCVLIHQKYIWPCQVRRSYTLLGFDLRHLKDYQLSTSTRRHNWSLYGQVVTLPRLKQIDYAFSLWTHCRGLWNQLVCKVRWYLLLGVNNSWGVSAKRFYLLYLTSLRTLSH